MLLHSNMSLGCFTDLRDAIVAGQLNCRELFFIVLSDCPLPQVNVISQFGSVIVSTIWLLYEYLPCCPKSYGIVSPRLLCASACMLK